MKWGVRRYQNKDGTLTNAGQRRYERDKREQKQNMTPDQKQAKRKRAVKIGAAVVGTALAAYGTYKIHDFVRQKNTDIRLKEGSAKCDRMLEKLGKQRIKERVNGSNGTEKWTNPRSYKRTGMQYNNNRNTVTLAREYRNTQPGLTPSQYRRVQNKIIDKTMSDAYDKARNDSFGTAIENVYKYSTRKRR